MSMTEREKLSALRGRSLAQMHNLVYRLKLLRAEGDELTPVKLRQADIGTRMPEAIHDALKRINLLLGTKYQKTHYYNWMSETVAVPGTVRRVMIREVFIWLFGADTASDYKGFWS